MADITHIFGGESFPAHVYEKIAPTFKDPVAEFHQVLQSHGLIVDFIQFNKLTRVPTIHNRRTKNGWYIYHDGKFPGGSFGDWQLSDYSNFWSAHSENELSPKERHEMQREREQQRLAREKEEARQEQEAKAEAVETLTKASQATGTYYTELKKITPSGGVRQAGQDLYIPILDYVNGEFELISYQKILPRPKDNKRFLFGGKIRGGFFLINNKMPKDKLYLCEGYATGETIHALTGEPVAIAYNAGNLKPALENIRQFFTGEIIIAADNDTETEGNPGVTQAKAAAASTYNARVLIPKLGTIRPETGKDKCDFNDLYIERGIDEARRQLSGQGLDRSLKLLSLDDLGEIQPTEWTVEDYLVSDSFSVLFGPSGHCKSFVALDWGLSIAAGEPWHGRQVKQGTVLYICGEGKNGVVKRVKAWQIHNRIPRINNFFVTSKPVRFLEGDDVRALDGLVDNLLINGHKIRAVIIDTLNRNFGSGDENATKDMTGFIDAVCALRDKTRAAVLVVHHTGLQDKDRARGNSALRAALDSEFKCQLSGDLVRVTCEKQKDDEPPKPMAFKKTSVDIETSHGFVNSLVLEVEKDPGAADDLAEGLIAAKGKREALALQIIRDMASEALKNRPEIASEGGAVIERKDIIDALISQNVPRSSAYFVLNNLCDKGVFIEHNEKIVKYIDG